jgi:hypothetical protein
MVIDQQDAHPRGIRSSISTPARFVRTRLGRCRREKNWRKFGPSPSPVKKKVKQVSVSSFHVDWKKSISEIT